jgi:hypothetical protein
MEATNKVLPLSLSVAMALQAVDHMSGQEFAVRLERGRPGSGR